MINISERLLRQLYLSENNSILMIAKKIGYTYETIRKSIIKYKIPLKTKSEACTKHHILEEELYDLYVIKQLNANEIAKIFSCSSTTILFNLEKYNIKKRTKSEAHSLIPNKYNADDEFLSKEVGFKESLFIGLMASDGYIGKGDRQNTFGISQAGEQGRLIIDWVKSILRFDGNIFTGIERTAKFGKKTYRCKEPHVISISSKELMVELEKYNIVNAKTRIYTFPEKILNGKKWKEKIAGFLVGYIFGDGSITLIASPNSRSGIKNKLKIEIGSCRYNFIERLDSVVYELLGIKGFIKKHSIGEHWYITWHGKSAYILGNEIFNKYSHKLGMLKNYHKYTKFIKSYNTFIKKGFSIYEYNIKKPNGINDTSFNLSQYAREHKLSKGGIFRAVRIGSNYRGYEIQRKVNSYVGKEILKIYHTELKKSEDERRDIFNTVQNM